MPTLRLNDRKVAALTAPDKRIEYFDATLPGFAVRVQPSGTKTFVLLYRSGGTLKRLTLGRFPLLGLAKAREKARAELRALDSGRDPVAAAKQAKTRTWSVLCDEYIEKHAKPKKKSWRDDRVMIDGEMQAWNDRPATSIRRADVRELLDDIVARGAGIQANRVLSLVRKIFNFALDREWVEINPAHRMARPAKERSRDRVLSEADLRVLWAFLNRPAPKAKRNETAAERERRVYHSLNMAALKLRLITAQRGNEVIGMRRSEIHGDWWTIPADRAKNGLSHRVPLTPMALEVIRELKDRPDQLFKGIVGTRQRHGVLDGLKIANVRPHDFRRTAASFMASSGVPRHVIAKVLNHVETGVTAVYDRHSYDREKRHALQSWAHLLDQAIAKTAKETEN